jgi:hypothetical protein
MKKHTKEELENIYLKLKGDLIGFQFFIDSYETEYPNTLKEVPAVADVAEETLNFTIEFYLKDFFKYLNEGHSPIYAHIRSKNGEESESVAINEAYCVVKKLDSMLAEIELITHCKNKGWTEPRQVNYFIQLVKDDVDNAGEKTVIYFENYKKQICKGKSTLYAHLFADNFACEYSECYCDAYAYLFEKALNENKSIDFIIKYADQLAEVFTNLYYKFEDALKDIDLFNYYHNQIIDRI